MTIAVLTNQGVVDPAVLAASLLKIAPPLTARGPGHARFLGQATPERRRLDLAADDDEPPRRAPPPDE